MYPPHCHTFTPMRHDRERTTNLYIPDRYPGQDERRRGDHADETTGEGRAAEESS